MYVSESHTVPNVGAFGAFPSVDAGVDARAKFIQDKLVH